MKNTNKIFGFGNSYCDGNSYIFFSGGEKDRFMIAKTKNGIDFDVLASKAEVYSSLEKDKKVKFSLKDSFSLTKFRNSYLLTYHLKKTGKLGIAVCENPKKDFSDWSEIVRINGIDGGAKLIPDHRFDKTMLLYAGGENLSLYQVKDFEKCILLESEVFDGGFLRPKKRGQKTTQLSHKDRVKVLDVAFLDNKNIFVVYGLKSNVNKNYYEIHSVVFDKKNPTKILESSKEPIQIIGCDDKKNVDLFGFLVLNKKTISYWNFENEGIFSYNHGYKKREIKKTKEFREIGQRREIEDKPAVLVKHENNPILAPRSYWDWECKATYNPTAFLHDGVVHIIYRADSNDLMSVWGYASSLDGTTITNRSNTCIFQRKRQTHKFKFPKPKLYTSGNNSAGGCEDPRAVLIDGVIYVIFTAFDGWSSLRVGLTSIKLEDFLAQRWNWKRTVLISPPGEFNKNWILFPEKINGKFAILHSYYPNILVDYFDSLDEFDGKTFIKSNNTRPIDTSRDWDGWFRGVGPAPIKTKDGWLVFYHAMDHRNPDRYRLGALLLDLSDPTKELCRTKEPILEPSESYENNGLKWGVVYSCGAVVKDGEVFVYYGGSDQYTCMAKMNLDELLVNIKGEGQVKINIK